MDAPSSDLDFATVDTLCERFYIMPRQLHEAKQLFDRYRNLGNNTNNSAAASVSPATSPATSRMSVKALEMVFKDLGVVKSNIEVRDMIDELTGHLTLLDKPRIMQNEEGKPQQQQPAPATQEDIKKRAKSSRPPSGVTSPQRNRLGGAAEAETEEEEQGAHHAIAELLHQEEGIDGVAHDKKESLSRSSSPHMEGISFEQFVYLLLGSFEEEEEMSVRKEIETSFKKMDVDGNGELSEQDIRHAIDQYLRDAHGERSQAYSVDQTDVLQLAANMHSAELQLALSECDLNGDGVVTLSDFALCLLRS